MTFDNDHNCGSKRQYASFREANEANNRYKGKRKKGRIEKLHAYKCLSCQQFHLGHEYFKPNPLNQRRYRQQLNIKKQENLEKSDHS